MKSGIHPNNHVVTARCVTCSSTFETQTTKKTDKEMLIDVCSKCHPFYVGKTSAAKVAGRVDRFNNKVSSVSGVKKKVKAAPKAKKKLSLSDLENINK